MSRAKMAIEGMLTFLEGIYGQFSSPALVQVIIDYVSREVHPDYLEELARALLRSHPIRAGQPDVAAFELAIKRAEERGESLRKPRQTMNWTSSPVLLEPPTEDERGMQLSMKAKAEVVGIDTNNDLWITSFIMHECARHARDSGKETLPGDRSARK